MVFFGCTAARVQIPSGYRTVSICDLSADPKAYEGKTIVVEGIVDSLSDKMFILQCPHDRKMTINVAQPSGDSAVQLSGRKARVLGTAMIQFNEATLSAVMVEMNDPVDRRGSRGGNNLGGHENHGGGAQPGGGHGGGCH